MQNVWGTEWHFTCWCAGKKLLTHLLACNGTLHEKVTYCYYYCTKMKVVDNIALLVEFGIGVDFLPHGCRTFHFLFCFVGWWRGIHWLQKDWISDRWRVFFQCVLHFLLISTTALAQSHTIIQTEDMILDTVTKYMHAHTPFNSDFPHKPGLSSCTELSSALILNVNNF